MKKSSNPNLFFNNQETSEALFFSLNITQIAEQLEKIIQQTQDPQIKAQTTIFKKELCDKLNDIKTQITNKTVAKNQYEVKSLIAQIRTSCVEYKKLEMNNETLEAIQQGLMHDVMQETAPLRDQVEALINGVRLDPKFTQSYALYCEQLYIFQSDAAFKKLLNTTLTQLHKLKLRQNPKWKKSLFISYAWPSIENREHEFWIQPFLQGLRYHLRLAGLKARLDFMDCEDGDNIYQYMDSLKDDDFALLVGSKSLFNKHVNGTNSVDTELNYLRDKWTISANSGTKSVFLASISGVFGYNFPKGYQWYKNIPDFRGLSWRGTSYLENLRMLLGNFLQINNNPEFLKIWAPIEEYVRAKNWPMSESEVNQSLDAARAAAQRWRTQPRNESHLLSRLFEGESDSKKEATTSTPTNTTATLPIENSINKVTQQTPKSTTQPDSAIATSKDSYTTSFDECAKKLNKSIGFLSNTMVDALDSHKPYILRGDNNLLSEMTDIITQLNSINVELESARETENDSLIITFVYKCQSSLESFNQKRSAFHNSMHAPLLAQICEQTQTTLDKVWQQIDIIADHSKAEQKQRATSEIAFIQQQCTLLEDETLNVSFTNLLAEIKKLDRPNKSSGKISVYLFHALEELSNFNELWLKNFTATLHEHLTAVDCSPVLYSKDKGRFTTKEAFYKQIRGVQHVCLFSTPCLKQQVEGKLIIENSAWVKCLQKIKREPEGVQLIRLFGTDINNPTLLELANVSDWPSEGYFKGLQQLIAKLYFGNARNETYESLWQDFYSTLAQHRSSKRQDSNDTQINDISDGTTHTTLTMK